MAVITIRKLEYIPQILIWEVCLGLIMVAAWSIYNGHVSLYMPYISETGTTFPEARLFTMITSITSVLGAAFFAIFFLSIQLWCEQEKENLTKHNSIALVYGLTACIGCFMVGMYPITKSIVMHGISAVILFFFGALHGLYNISLSSRFCPTHISQNMLNVRKAAAASIAVTTVILTWGAIHGYYLFGFPSERNLSAVKTPEDPGFTYLAMSACAEWLYVALGMLYTATFIPSFKKMNLSCRLEYNDSNICGNNNTKNGDVN